MTRSAWERAQLEQWNWNKQNSLSIKRSYSYYPWGVLRGLFITSSLSKRWMKTLLTHRDIKCVWGDRKWTLRTTTVTQILQADTEHSCKEESYDKSLTLMCPISLWRAQTFPIMEPQERLWEWSLPEGGRTQWVRAGYWWKETPWKQNVVVIKIYKKHN